MAYQKLTSVVVSATGTAISGPCVVKVFHLAGGSDATTAIIRDGGALGPIRCKLAAATASSDNYSSECGFRFTTDVHVTFSGTGPVLSVAIDNPQANQLNPS